MGIFSCCGPQPRDGEPRPKRQRPRRQRRKHRKLNSLPRVSADGAAASTLSETDYQECRDAFSETGDMSPTHHAAATPRATGPDGAAVEAMRPARSPRVSETESYYETDTDGEGSESGSGSGSGSEEDDGLGSRLVSCLNITGTEKRHKAPHSVAVPFRSRPPAGLTLPRREVSCPVEAAVHCWDETDASTYKLRSLDYMKTKVKESGGKAFYRLVAVDVYSTPQKAFHVARSVHLPPTHAPVVLHATSTSEPVVLPPLLIMNVQLPSYPTPLFGANDGPGLSIVYYFTLPEDFDPAKCENHKALGLLQRFVANGREADGSPTRERLKMIARVSNVAEFVEKAQLSGAEQRLLTNYNEKPVLTRPQQMFYVGPNYLEVDLDVHSYAFLARKALNGYHARIKHVVWDNAFVLQGNSPEELPEQLIAAGRIYRTDIANVPSLEDAFAAHLAASPAHASATQAAAPATPATANSSAPVS